MLLMIFIGKQGFGWVFEQGVDADHARCVLFVYMIDFNLLIQILGWAGDLFSGSLLDKREDACVESTFLIGA